MSQLSYLALGDSYTIGEGVAPSGRWPLQLVELLREDGFSFKAPEIIATTGWTTGELISGINDANPSGPFKLISLLIGVNNQYRGLPVDSFRSEFTELILRAIALAGGNHRRIFVLSIPDWGYTPFASGRDRKAISLDIDTFNLATQEICSNHDVLYFNITGYTRLNPVPANMVAEDGLHPSEAMYRVWVDAIRPALTDRLKELYGF